MLVNRNNIVLILLTILDIGIGKTFAQDTTLVIGSGMTWNLEKCIDYAKKNNIQINSLRLSQLTSQQQYLLAKAARLPNLSGSAAQNFAHANSGNTEGGYSPGFNANSVYGISSSVTLYNGNLINNTIRQAEASMQSADLDVTQQENDITLQVTQAYLAVLADKESIIYDTDLLNTTTAQVKREQQLYNAGSVARSALVQLQAQLATDEYTLAEAKNAERSDLLNLKQILLLQSDVSFDIEKPDTVATIDHIAPLRDAEQSALNNFPDLKIGQLGVKSALYGVDIAKAGYRPTLIAGASLNSGYNSTTGNSYPGQLGNNFSQQLGFTLVVPIFTKRVVKTQVAEAKIVVDEAQLNLKNETIILSQNVEKTYINVGNAKSQYAAALNQYVYNQESYRIASEQLKVGAANTVDFLLQKNLFIQALQAYIQAKYNMLLTVKIYDFYRGIPIKL